MQSYSALPCHLYSEIKVHWLIGSLNIILEYDIHFINFKTFDWFFFSLVLTYSLTAFTNFWEGKMPNHALLFDQDYLITLSYTPFFRISFFSILKI